MSLELHLDPGACVGVPIGSQGKVTAVETHMCAYKLFQSHKYSVDAEMSSICHFSLVSA